MNVEKAIDKFNKRRKKTDFRTQELVDLFAISKKEDGDYTICDVDLWNLAINCLQFGYEKGRRDA